MKHSYSICPHCGCGCGLYLVEQDGLAGGVTASQSHYLGQGQLCARGWTSHQLLASDKRITTPLVRNGKSLAESPWDQALEAAAKKLKAVKEKHGGNSIGVIASSRLTSREAATVREFAEAVLDTSNYDSAARLSSVNYRFPRPARTQDIASSDLIVVLGANLLEDNPILGQRVLSCCKPEADRPYVSPDLTHLVPEPPAKLAVMDSQRNHLARHAQTFLWCRPGREGHVLIALLKQLVERFNIHSTVSEFRQLKESLAKLPLGQLLDGSGVNHSDLESLARDLSSAARPVLLFGKGLLHQPEAFEACTALANLAVLMKDRLSVLPVMNGANDYGVGRMLNSKDGLSYPEIIEAVGKKQVKALVLIGEDPLRSLPGQETVEKALDQLELLVTVDSFAGPAAERSGVVLPWMLLWEKEGVFYNTDGIGQEFKPAQALAGQPYRTLEDILQALARLLGGKLEIGDRQLPEFEEVGLEPVRVIEIESEALPFNLELGSVYPHLYGGEGQTLNSYHLSREFVGNYLEMNPEDIADLGLRSGWKARVVTNAGALETVVRANPNIYKKTVFMPVHFGGNRLAPFRYDSRLKTPVFKGIPARVEKI